MCRTQLRYEELGHHRGAPAKWPSKEGDPRDADDPETRMVEAVEEFADWINHSYAGGGYSGEVEHHPELTAMKEFAHVIKEIDAETRRLKRRMMASLTKMMATATNMIPSRLLSQPGTIFLKRTPWRRF